MVIPPEALFQLVIGILLGIVGWSVRQVLARVDGLEHTLEKNTGRLIRIETKLGIPPNGNGDTN